MNHPKHEDLSQCQNNHNSITFEASKLTISDVMEMITRVCVRFNLSYEVRKAIVDLTKCLARPQYNNWQMSKYKI